MSKNSSLQKYIPMSRADVREAMLSDRTTTPDIEKGLRKVCTMMEAIWHHRMHHDLETLKSAYAPIDPDLGDDVDLSTTDSFLDRFDSVVRAGNWEEVTQKEIDFALNGEDIFPISLRVRFEEFVECRLYKLGESRSVKNKKTWFGLVKSEVEVDVYDRIIQVLQFRDRSWFASQKKLKHWPGEHSNGMHIRLFKSVPKRDLEVVFPNTSPQMRFLDRVKVVAPLLGGMVAVVMKFGPLLLGNSPGQTSNAVIGGILSAVGTYALKSYFSYRKTKEKYLQQVSKDLYFKGLANDEAVLSAVIDLAEEQEVKEAMLAYWAMVLEGPGHFTPETLDDRIEQWLAGHGVEVDFEVDDAIKKLRGLGLVEGGDSNARVLTAVPINVALQKMDEYWDGIFEYA